MVPRYILQSVIATHKFIFLSLFFYPIFAIIVVVQQLSFAPFSFLWPIYLNSQKHTSFHEIFPTWRVVRSFLEYIKTKKHPSVKLICVLFTFLIQNSYFAKRFYTIIYRLYRSPLSYFARFSTIFFCFHYCPTINKNKISLAQLKKNSKRPTTNKSSSKMYFFLNKSD